MMLNMKFLGVTVLLVLPVLVFSSEENSTIFECKRTKLGEEYNGCENQTRDGYTCQSWASQSPHKHDIWKNFPDGSEEEAQNYCRNPDGSGEEGPWCYTTNPKVRWNYCKIPICDGECKTTEKGEEYNGTTSTTVHGYTCQKWTSQSPHKHDEWKVFPDGSAEAAGNYCRNPDGSGDEPWCYTTDEDTRWDYCDIALCESSDAD
jgi:hypothetical protein